MFGGIRIKASKPTPRKLPGSSRFAFIRTFTDRWYRDPYRWGLLTGIAFFLASVVAARALTDLEILADESSAGPGQGVY